LLCPVFSISLCFRLLFLFFSISYCSF
jgi:hypothetical protein